MNEERVRMFNFEALYWLNSLEDKFADRNRGIMNAYGNREITRHEIGEITRAFKERIIKRRGKEAARALFKKMVELWPEWQRGHDSTAKIIYGGEDYLINTLGSTNI